MPDSQVDTAPDEWLTAVEAAERMGISVRVFSRVARAGSIRRRAYPGVRPVYHADDVQRIIDGAVTAPTVD